MKQILQIAVLIVFFCFAAQAQDSAQNCQQLHIKTTPELVERDESFVAGVDGEKSSQYANAQIRWTVIKGSKAVEKIGKNSISIDARDFKNGNELIMVLAEADDGTCRSFATAKVFVLPVCAVTLDEYAQIKWIDEKARLDNIAQQVKTAVSATPEQKNSKLFVFLNFAKNTEAHVVKNRLARILEYFSTTHSIEKEKIVFSVAESNAESVSYHLIPVASANLYGSQNLIIQGEQFDKLEKLFQPKSQKR